MFKQIKSNQNALQINKIFWNVCELGVELSENQLPRFCCLSSSHSEKQTDTDVDTDMAGVFWKFNLLVLF